MPAVSATFTENLAPHEGAFDALAPGLHIHSVDRFPQVRLGGRGRSGAFKAMLNSVEKPARRRLQGLYAVTPDTDDDAWLFEAVAAAIAGGASAVQYRSKTSTAATRVRQAGRLVEICCEHEVPLIVNDSIELALESGAAGIHLGRDDPDPLFARERLGDEFLIGVSCYNEFARAAHAAGIADHVAFGSLFGSRVKPGAVRAPLELLGRAREQGWNVVGIGGIDADNVGGAVETGADAVAVITALFGSPGGPVKDIERAALALCEKIRTALREGPGQDRARAR
jgi:thiamine-phosphate pyrophosphorylase